MIASPLRQWSPTRSPRETELGKERRGRALTVLGAALAAWITLAGGASVAAQGTAGGERIRAVEAPLRIRQLDVGQGDAALLTTPEGRHILIDAGPSPDAVARMLAAAGVDTLALVIASHNHADHIGGMPEVLRRFVVRAYVENGLPHTTATYARTLAAVEREPGLQYLSATDRTITIGTVTVRILPPPRVDRSQNNNSVGALVEYGRFRALFTGDAEVEELRGWLRTGRIPQVTLLKVSHHGSSNGTAPEWIRATAPAVAVLSLSLRNSYGHPSPGVEMAWLAGGARVYRTDRDGTMDVSVTSDGAFTIRGMTSAGPPRR